MSDSNDLIEDMTLKLGEFSVSAIGAGNGPLVLLLHGFPDHAQTWREQISFLAAYGYRALAVTLRGYEPQSIPEDGDFSEETLGRDVLNVLDALGVQRAHLVGHDWGAAIAYRAANLSPDRFLSLTTMAVPHSGRFLNDAFTYPKQALMSWYMLFFQLRGIADYWVARNDFAFLRWLWRRWSPGWAIPEDEFQALRETMSKPGVLRAALAYYRTALSLSALPVSSARRAANCFQVPVPTLGLTGEQEGCIDADVFQRLMREEDFPRGLRVLTVPDAGHFLHREQAQRVNQLLLDWFREHDQSTEGVEP